MPPVLVTARGWLDVPVQPDADEARRWATEELSRGVYTQRTGLLQRVLDWLADLIAQLQAMAAGGPGWLLPVVAIVVTAVVVTVALLVSGPVRRRRAVSAPGPVLAGDERTSQQLREAADAAAARGDHPTAVVERFRAVVRALAERALVDDRPGLTADEAARAGGERLPTLAADLAAAAALFDGVRYGRRRVGAQEDAWLTDVDHRTAAARPVDPAPVGRPAG